MVKTVTIKEKKYKLSHLTGADWAEFELYLRSRKARMIKDIPDYSKGKKAKLIDKVTNEGMSDIDLSAEALTIAGICFLLWRSLLKYKVGITLKEVSEMVDLGNLSGITRTLNTVNVAVLPDEDKARNVTVFGGGNIDGRNIS